MSGSKSEEMNRAVDEFGGYAAVLWEFDILWVRHMAGYGGNCNNISCLHWYLCGLFEEMGKATAGFLGGYCNISFLIREFPGSNAILSTKTKVHPPKILQNPLKAPLLAVKRQHNQYAEKITETQLSLPRLQLSMAPFPPYVNEPAINPASPD